MFCRFFTIVLISLVVIPSATAETIIPGGEVSGLWDAAGSPYLIMGDITLDDEDSLTIEPGVDIIFQQYVEFDVYGTLVANGTYSDSIHFTARDSSCWGGIRCISNPNPILLSYCIIEYGSGSGAVYLLSAQAILEHCTIRRCYSQSYGGGLGASGSTIVVDHCLFEECYGFIGAGVGCNESDITIRNSIFYKNDCNGGCGERGGGIHCDYSTGMLIQSCDFYENWSEVGAGISLEYSEGRVENCRFYRNDSNSGGGISLTHCDSVCVDRCLFAENEADKGGAISAYGCLGCSVEHCTMSDNTVQQNGAAISVFYEGIAVENCVFSNDTGTEDVYIHSGGAITIDYCIFDENAANHFIGSVPPGIGSLALVNQNGDSCDGYYNLFQIPQFVDPQYDDYRLLWGSPCIDAGNPDPQQNDPDGTISDMGYTFYNQSMPIRVLLIPYEEHPLFIPSSGGSFDYDIHVTNIDETPISFDLWCDVTLPDGSHYGPLMGPYNVTISGETTTTRMRIQSVPAGAPPGDYDYTVHAIAESDTTGDHFTFFKAAQSGADGRGSWQNQGESFVEASLIQWQGKIPAESSLLHCHPNPFNPTTTISYQLTADNRVSLAVYDVTGRQVAGLVNGWRDAGIHEVIFDGSGLASGVYFYRLTAGDFTSVGKLVLMK